MPANAPLAAVSVRNRRRRMAEIPASPGLIRTESAPLDDEPQACGRQRCPEVGERPLTRLNGSALLTRES
jgi:hypothetical protein